jgi:hypothetical protein
MMATGRLAALSITCLLLSLQPLCLAVLPVGVLRSLFQCGLPVRCPRVAPCLALCLCCGHCDSLEFGAHSGNGGGVALCLRWWTVACKASAVMRGAQVQAALVLLGLLTGSPASVCLTECGYATLACAADECRLRLLTAQSRR